MSRNERTTAPKPPKRALRWGVYSKRGVLYGVRDFRYQAEAAAKTECLQVERVLVTPIATRRRAKP